MKDKILALVLLKPVIVDSPIDIFIKYQTVNGLMLYKRIANAGCGLLSIARTSSPIGNR